MSLSVLIVEDEIIIADDIALTLEQNGYEVIGVAADYQHAIELITKKNPDIILLDIMIKGSKTGLDLGAEIQLNYNLPFIYLTSLFDHKTVTKANETFPVGYIVKPFKEPDLLVALQMGWKKFKMRTPIAKQKKNEIFIRMEGALVPLKTDTLLYAEGSDNYTYLHTIEGKKVVSQTLKSIEEALSSQDFQRIHKSYLVNLRKIERIEHSVIFINGNPLPIGKVYKKSLMEALTVW
jgi:two-component system response regulator LytT